MYSETCQRWNPSGPTCFVFKSWCFIKLTIYYSLIHTVPGTEKIGPHLVLTGLLFITVPVFDKFPPRIIRLTDCTRQHLYMSFIILSSPCHYVVFYSCISAVHESGSWRSYRVVKSRTGAWRLLSLLFKFRTRRLSRNSGVHFGSLITCKTCTRVCKRYITLSLDARRIVYDDKIATRIYYNLLVYRSAGIQYCEAPNKYLTGVVGGGVV